MIIGILALQGAFAEHAAMLKRLNTDSFEIRQTRDALRYMDGLILPGGESTAIGKLLHELGLHELLAALIYDGLPVFGTCAGMILLANNIINDDAKYFASMNISVKRNGYGRQQESFFIRGTFAGQINVPMPFIRAPYIQKTGPRVKIMAETGGRIIAAKEEKQLVCAFHPELTDNLTVHQYFLDMINQN